MRDISPADDGFSTYYNSNRIWNVGASNIALMRGERDTLY